MIRLTNGVMLVLEVKGEEDDRAKVKHAAMRDWVDAVNADGRFGMWAFEVASRPHQVLDIVKACSKR